MILGHKIGRVTTVFLAMLAFVTIATFIIFWTFHIFGIVFISTDSKATEDIVIAFTGAFFAFLFIRMADWFNAIYARQKRHYDALVLTEHSLIEAGAILNDDLYVLQNLRIAASAKVVNWSNTHSLPISTLYKRDLSDLKLMNELFSFYESVRKYNDDMEIMTISCTELRAPLLSGTMPLDFYMEKMEEIAEQLVKPLEVFSEQIQDELLDVTAAIRLRIGYDMPLFTRLYSLMLRFRKKLRSDELARERGQIRKELDESTAESRKQIEKMIEKIKKRE